MEAPKFESFHDSNKLEKPETPTFQTTLNFKPSECSVSSKQNKQQQERTTQTTTISQISRFFDIVLDHCFLCGCQGLRHGRAFRALAMSLGIVFRSTIWASSSGNRVVIEMGVLFFGSFSIVPSTLVVNGPMCRLASVIHKVFVCLPLLHSHYMVPGCLKLADAGQHDLLTRGVSKTAPEKWLP